MRPSLLPSPTLPLYLSGLRHRLLQGPVAGLTAPQVAGIAQAYAALEFPHKTLMEHLARRAVAPEVLAAPAPLCQAGAEGPVLGMARRGQPTGAGVHKRRTQ
jgi:hypothetical protein